MDNDVASVKTLCAEIFSKEHLYERRFAATARIRAAQTRGLTKGKLREMPTGIWNIRFVSHPPGKDHTQEASPEFSHRWSAAIIRYAQASRSNRVFGFHRISTADLVA